MKITKLCLLLFSITLLVACKQEEKPVEVIETKVVETKVLEKETVIVKDTATVAPVEKKGTKVSVSGNGVKVEGANIDIEVKK